MGEAERYETLCTVTREPVDESAEVAEQWTFKVKDAPPGLMCFLAHLH